MTRKLKIIIFLLLALCLSLMISIPMYKISAQEDTFTNETSSYVYNQTNDREGVNPNGLVGPIPEPAMIVSIIVMAVLLLTTLVYLNKGRITKILNKVD